MRTYRISEQKKPWYRRWFSKNKVEWVVETEFPAFPEGEDAIVADLENIVGLIVGEMTFKGADLTYVAHAYKDGTSVIYVHEDKTK